MRRRVRAVIALAAGGLAPLFTVLIPSSAPAALVNLSSEQIVLLASGEYLTVPGYSVPCFTDFNGDGLNDLLVGEGGAGFDGKIRVYRNRGSAVAPRFSDFTYVQSEGADLVVPAGGCLGAFPLAVDFDGDGNKDLLVGRADGTVSLFRNVGTNTAPTFDGGTLVEAGPAGAKSPIDVGYRATMAVTDWDNDGTRDLVLGGLDGRIHLYLNHGRNAEPDFLAETIVQDSTGDLMVPSGRSSPALTDFDRDGRVDLVAGNTNGAILIYPNQGSDATPGFSTYETVAANGVEIDLPGMPRSRPFITDWTGDGRPDLLVGAGDGRIHLFQGIPEPASLWLLAVAAVVLVSFQWNSGRSIRR